MKVYSKNASITVRTKSPYKVIKRNVYFKRGYGTFIILNGRKKKIAFTLWNNSGYTL